MTYYEEDTPEIELERAERKKLVPSDTGTIQHNESKSDPVKQELDKTVDDVRHDEMMEMLGGLFIQMSRIYDALMLQLGHNERELAEKYHSSGKLLTDPPILEEDAWS